MVTIQAIVYNGDDCYTITASDVSPLEAAKQVMEAREKILDIIEKEEANANN